MTSNPTEGLVEAIRAPSYQQDSAWHVAPFNYVTKPKALLSEAADRIEALEGERDQWRETAQGHRDDANQFDRERRDADAALTTSQARISELERDEGASNAISGPTPKSADTGAELSAVREPCDRAQIIIDRMQKGLGWRAGLPVTSDMWHVLKPHLRIALDTEVEAGGPFLNNGWNRP